MMQPDYFASLQPTLTWQEAIEYVFERGLDIGIMFDSWEAAYDPVPGYYFPVEISRAVSEAIKFQIILDFEDIRDDHIPLWFRHGVRSLPELLRRGEMHPDDLIELWNFLDLPDTRTHPQLPAMYDMLRTALGER
jgi:hypothetical protein